MERLHGAITALVTPMKDNQVDEESLANLIEFQISQGINGLVPCGTTGESATLSMEEHKRVIELTVRLVNKRVPVIAGAGANNTGEAVELTEAARESGADVVLSVAPYYNNPTQEGIYQHFKTIATSVDIPILLYNVPGRTVVNMTPKTVARLAELPNIIGIKEANHELQQVANVIRLCPPDFVVISGDDFTAFPSVCVGAKGVISVVSNLIPGEMAALMKAALAGDLAKARALHYRFFPLMEAMFAYKSPAPAKKGLHMMGKIASDHIRLPMVQMDADATDGPAAKQRLEQAMQAVGLL